ncbi:MAG: sulfurtransferase-like selenium metabolism protein YedF [Nitrospirae bacterium]|nr:sulfurtransferase-like selenium metabolism protein YedF [Nitrospirota bacterium]
MFIDAKGLACPKPVIVAEEALAKIDEGTVEILVDNEASVKNLTRFASKNAFYSEAAKEDNYWKVKIVKGYPCETPEAVGSQQSAPKGTVPDLRTYHPFNSPPKLGGEQGEVESGLSPEQAEQEPGKELLLIIGSDTMGKNEELGTILIKAFFETIKVTKEIPHTIFFLNAGVKLTTVNEEIIPILKELEAMDVEIFSCGTCLKHYNLEAELKVGYRGTTNHIVEGMKDFKKTVWIS